MKRGLTSKEQAIYNNSLGNLCAKLMNTSRSTLASKGSSLSVDRGVGRIGGQQHRHQNRPLQRHSSLDEATEREKALIVSSLTQLCMRLKSVSRESSIGRASVPPSMTFHDKDGMIKQQKSLESSDVP